MPRGEIALELPHDAWFDAAVQLRDEFGFEQLIDLCGVDYLSYGSDEWDTDVSSEGFSRGVEGKAMGRFVWGEQPSGAGIAPAARGMPCRPPAVSDAQPAPAHPHVRTG